MRISAEERAAIRNAVEEHFGANATVWLFGSRVDDSKRGGDIDLLVCPSQIDEKTGLAKKIALMVSLEKTLGERQIDVIMEQPNDVREIVRIARSTGVML